MKLLELLVGKTIMVMTDVGVAVPLVVASIEECKTSVNLEPPSPANDWWPMSEDIITYVIVFTNGVKKTYNSINAIEILN